MIVVLPIKVINHFKNGESFYHRHDQTKLKYIFPKQDKMNEGSEGQSHLWHVDSPLKYVHQLIRIRRNSIEIYGFGVNTDMSIWYLPQVTKSSDCKI